MMSVPVRLMARLMTELSFRNIGGSYVIFALCA